MNWNDTIRVGNVDVLCELAAGWLVALDDGRWSLVTDISWDYNEWQDVNYPCFDLLGIDEDWNGKVEPLLPPPSKLYTAWDALRSAGSHMTLALGEISWSDERDLPDYMRFSECPLMSADELPETLADMQKFGALLEWLKIWEATR